MRIQLASACAVVVLVCVGAFAAEPAPPPREVVRYIARVTSREDGAIEQITLRGDGIEKAFDLKADADEFAKKLKELVEKNQGNRLTLTLEVDGTLLYSHVVRLHDNSVRAGFKDISWLLHDPKKR